ncbi:MAG: two-component system chemotaxis response regulator CheY [bacterium]|jgi:two-component system chemotaxis response regulator CheY
MSQFSYLDNTSQDFPKKILVIDQSTFLRRSIARKLEMWGYKVSVAMTDKEAMKKMDGGYWPDLVIREADISGQQSDKEQFEILKYILSRQQKNGFCYYIFLVEPSDQDFVQIALDFGVHEIIEKPIKNLDWFHSRIGTCLRNIAVVRMVDEKKKELAKYVEELHNIHKKTARVLKEVKDDRFSSTSSRKNYYAVEEIHKETQAASDFYKDSFQPIQIDESEFNNSPVEDRKIKKTKILIVDDNEMNLQLLRKILEKYVDSEIHSANNGLEAIDQFELAHKTGRPFDCVLLDIIMPEVDGRTALKAMREIERELDVPRKDQSTVAMVTSLDDRHNMLLTHQEGCNHYIVKPITKEKLDKLLNQL